MRDAEIPHDNSFTETLFIQDIVLCLKQGCNNRVHIALNLIKEQEGVTRSEQLLADVKSMLDLNSKKSMEVALNIPSTSPESVTDLLAMLTNHLGTKPTKDYNSTEVLVVTVNRLEEYILSGTTTEYDITRRMHDWVQDNSSYSNLYQYIVDNLMPNLKVIVAIANIDTRGLDKQQARLVIASVMGAEITFYKFY